MTGKNTSNDHNIFTMTTSPDPEVNVGIPSLEITVFLSNLNWNGLCLRVRKCGHLRTQQKQSLDLLFKIVPETKAIKGTGTRTDFPLGHVTVAYFESVERCSSMDCPVTSCCSCRT
jgi:hypothetical protein